MGSDAASQRRVDTSAGRWRGLSSGGLPLPAMALLRPAFIRASISARGESSVSATTISDTHCLALGRLCVAWAFVDRQLNDLIQYMIGCSDASAASIATVADGTASRCNLIKLLNHERPISEGWTAALHKLISEIQEVAQVRNRYVHDRWELTDDSIVRIDRRAAARKGQSR
jgi:hypothetical protein